MHGALLLAIGGLIVVGLEIALRRYRPLADPYASEKSRRPLANPYVPRGYAPNYVAEIEVTGVPELPTRGRLTANSLGLRTPEFSATKPKGIVRIALLGGSAMECWHLGDELTVRAVFERELAELTGAATEVIFAGAWAARSYDLVASLGHRVMHLQPDLVVVAGGLGDVFEVLDGRDYLLPPVTGPEVGKSTFRLLAQVATQYQLGRIVHRAFQRRTSRPGAARLVGSELLGWYSNGPAPGVTTTPIRVPSARPYLENLTSAVGMALAHRIPVVLCTQPTQINTPRPELGADPWMPVGSTSFRRSLVGELIDTFNDATRELAQSLDVPLCDLAGMFDGDSESFYDDFHYGSVGAARTAGALANFVARLPPHLPASPYAMYAARHR